MMGKAIQLSSTRFRTRLPQMAALSVLFIACGVAPAIPPDLLKAVPRDAAAAYFVAGKQSDSGAGTQSALEMAGFWINRAQDMGLLVKLDSTSRAWVDALGLVAVILKYPHALVLLDIAAEPMVGGGHQLARMNAAVVIHSQGKNAEIERQVQHLLNSYTNSDETTLSSDNIRGRTCNALRDRRLKDWTVLQWGALGDYYVLALGERAFDRLEATLGDSSNSIAGEPWFSSAMTELKGDGAAFAGFIDFDLIRRGSDPGLGAKLERVKREIHLDAAKRAAMVVRMEGERVEVTALANRSAGNELFPLTIRGADRETASRAIPPDATWNLMLDIEPRTWMNGICGAYLVGRRPPARREGEYEWRQLEEESGISIEKDIFSRLGRGIIIHNYPQHVLHLPLAWTRLIRIDHDAPGLRASIDKLFDVWRRRLGDTGPLKLRRAEDGVWYLHFGLQGPAFAVTDQWVVISFSPEAVRENIAFLRSRAPSPPAAAPAPP